jgi:hypothetical protein
MKLANDQRTLDTLLGELGKRPSDEELDEQERDALEAGLRGSVIDPPFATLIKRAEALNYGAGKDDGVRTEFARRLDEKLNALEQEIEAMVDGFDEWTQHIADYGFDKPELSVAVLVVASVDPELRAAKFETNRELAQWLLANPVSLRVLKRALSWHTCTFGTGRRLESEEHGAAVQRRFLWRVFCAIVDEVRDMHRSPP